jgi:iron complex outermembrane receptor protein
MYEPLSKIPRQRWIWFGVASLTASLGWAQTPPRTDGPTPTNYPPVQVVDSPLQYRQFEKVEITGSSILRNEQTQALPVQVVTRQEMQRKGLVSLTEVVQNLSNVFNGLELTQMGMNPGGFTSAALHGMPTGTLVLLNGKRLSPYGIQNISGKERANVDLGMIPLAAVERIEVLGDGASTLYGTDAIAGVINIITRTEFRGVEVFAGHTRPRGGAGQGNLASLNWGRGQLQRDGFRWQLAAEADQYEALKSADRAFAAQGRRGFAHAGQWYEADSPKVSAFSSPAWIYSPRTTQKAYSALVVDGECIQDGLSYRGLPGTCRQNMLPTYDIYPERSGQRLHLLGEVVLNSSTRLFSEWLYSKQQSRIAINDWRTISGRIVNEAGAVGYDEMLAQGMDPAFGFYYWQPNLRALRQQFDKTQMRAVLGLKGQWVGWDYQASIYQAVSKATHVHERADYAALGLSTTGLSNPLKDPRLLQPLDGQNSLTMQLLDTRYGQHQATGQTTFSAAELRASRALMEIDGKDALLGWGLEWRQEKAATEFDASLPSPSFQGRRKNFGAYAELQIPLRENWDMIASVRSDQYNDVGTTNNGKLATRWAVNPKVAVRGSVGTGFRAPSIGQMQQVDAPFTNGSFTLTACTPQMLAVTNELVAADGLPVICPANGITQTFTNGNPNLRPEKSRQASLGVAFTPSRNLSWAADYWRVDMRDTLQFESLSAVLADPQAHASNYMVNPTVMTRNFGTEKFHHLGFLLQMKNLGASVKEGIDLDVRYRVPLDAGRLMLGLQATYMLTAKEKTSPGAQWSSDLKAYSVVSDQVTPRLKSRWMMLWEQKDISLQLNANYQTGYTDKDVRAFNTVTGKIETVSGRRVGSDITWDVLGQYQVTPAWQWRMGLINLTDRRPPLSFFTGTTAVWGVNSHNNTLKGRTMHLGMTYKF